MFHGPMVSMAISSHGTLISCPVAGCPKAFPGLLCLWKTSQILQKAVTASFDPWACGCCEMDLINCLMPTCPSAWWHHLIVSCITACGRTILQCHFQCGPWGCVHRIADWCSALQFEWRHHWLALGQVVQMQQGIAASWLGSWWTGLTGLILNCLQVHMSGSHTSRQTTVKQQAKWLMFDLSLSVSLSHTHTHNGQSQSNNLNQKTEMGRRKSVDVTTHLKICDMWKKSMKEFLRRREVETESRCNSKLKAKYSLCFVVVIERTSY